MQWPNPYDPGRLAGVREEARRLFEETDYLVVADIMCLGPFEGACFLRGYEQFCMDLYWNLDMAHAILDKVTETDIALWDLFLQNVGDYVQVVAQGDDLGTQRGTWIGPRCTASSSSPTTSGSTTSSTARPRRRSSCTPADPSSTSSRTSSKSASTSSTPSSAARPRWTSPP